jgi:hypothetical protein
MAEQERFLGEQAHIGLAKTIDENSSRRKGIPFSKTDLPQIN